MQAVPGHGESEKKKRNMHQVRKAQDDTARNVSRM